MVVRSILIALVAFVIPAAAQSQSQARDEEQHWRMALGQKADVIQQNIHQRHWIEGTHPSLVVVPSDGGPVDYGTTGACNIAHSSTWTGCYLVGIAFRYGWAKEHGTPADVEAALNVGGQIANGLYMLSHVSGTPGFLSRGIAYGYGPSYEERGGSGSSDAWAQGVGPYSDRRFRTGPSHHNYHHVTRGLSFWYYFLDKYNPNPTGRVKAQMDSVRATLTELFNYAYKSHDLVVMDFDGTMSTTLLGGNEGQGFASTRVMMVSDALTWAFWITKDPWYKQRLQQIVRDYNYLGPNAARRMIADNDDTEHVLSSLWLAYQVEQDPRLKTFYQAAATSLFNRYRTDRRSLYNYVYGSITGDAAGADYPGALRTLQEYPSVTFFWPVMNSIRTDIEFTRDTTELDRPARPSTRDALPFYDAPMDNEYDWKGNPHQLDGWLARPITSLAVSGESPMVWFFTDSTNTLYQSLDGGRKFFVNDYRSAARIRSITFAGNKSRIAFINSGGTVLRTMRGGDANITNIDYFGRPVAAWDPVQIGPEGNVCRQIMVDDANPNVMWAVMADGVYRSTDLGRNDIGKLWQKVTTPVPADWSMTYWVATGTKPVVYALGQGQLMRAQPGEAWTIMPSGRGGGRGGGTRQIAIMPGRPDTVLFLSSSGGGGGGMRGMGMSRVTRSLDGGRTMEGAGARGMGTRAARGAPDPSGIERGTEITSLVFDPVNPQIVYAASSKGFYRSTDGGVKWTLSNNGLRIPLVYAVYAPKGAPGKLYASTPAGLHVSSDGGQTWSAPIFVPNGPGVDRVDRGGMGYISAYWAGRYFGKVTDDQVAQPPTAWGW